MDFGGGETRKSAENELAEEVKRNTKLKMVIFFNLIYQADGYFFDQKKKGAFFRLGKELISKRKV